jgi:hypothetical protein
MDNAKQMNAVAVLCTKPPKVYGKIQAEGERTHDWAYLARQIAYFDSGKACDERIAKEIAKVLRKKSNFPNGPDWDERVNAPGAHESILEIVRTELATAARP